MPILNADEKDITSLVELMDSAYRGENSKQGWTSEADLFIGNKRTDETTVANLIKKPGSIFLKYLNEEEVLGNVLPVADRGSKEGGAAVPLH